MRIIILISITTLFSILTYSQENKENESWLVSIKSGPSWSQYNFKPLSNIEQSLGYTLDKKLNMNYGINLIYFQERISLKVGISFLDKGYKQNYTWTAPNGIDPALDPVVPVSSTLNAYYVNGGIAFGYSVVKQEKISITPYINFMYGGLVKFKETTIYGKEGKTTKETNLIYHQLADKILTLSFSLDARYNLTQRIGVLISPYLAKDVNSVDNNLITNTNYILGGRLGLYINL